MRSGISGTPSRTRLPTVRGVGGASAASTASGKSRASVVFMRREECHDGPGTGHIEFPDEPWQIIRRIRIISLWTVAVRVLVAYNAGLMLSLIASAAPVAEA